MNTRFILIILCIVALILFTSLLKSKKLKGNVLGSLLYAIFLGVLLGAGGLFGRKEWFEISYHIVYIIICAWMLILGVLNMLFLKKIMPWAGKETYSTELLFTVFTAFMGAIALTIVFILTKFQFYISINLTTILLFVLPYLLMGVLLKFMRIPVRIYRMWHYPADKYVEDPTDREMESPLVIGFEFKKNHLDKSVTTFRAKAPKEMLFGKLFYYFINDYNHRNPHDKIQYLDENNKPHSWIFYFKPKLFRKVRYIDPEETNSFNFIKENSVIVCKRVIEI